MSTYLPRPLSQPFDVLQTVHKEYGALLNFSHNSRPSWLVIISRNLLQLLHCLGSDHCFLVISYQLLRCWVVLLSISRVSVWRCVHQNTRMYFRCRRITIPRRLASSHRRRTVLSEPLPLTRPTTECVQHSSEASVTTAMHCVAVCHHLVDLL